MKPIDELIAQVREAALKATGGKWTACNKGGDFMKSVYANPLSLDVVAIMPNRYGDGDKDNVQSNHDAAFIALMSPVNALRLCDELARCREALKGAAEVFAYVNGCEDKGIVPFCGDDFHEKWSAINAALKGGE